MCHMSRTPPSADAIHRFPSTRHSLLKAPNSLEPLGREALSSLIAVYWKPSYKYVRIKWRRSNEDAKDLVQGFFTALIERDILANFDPAKGQVSNLSSDVFRPLRHEAG